MSEYQYYEWQTLERPLTAAEQKTVNGLSSHIDVTSTQAVVTYENLRKAAAKRQAEEKRKKHIAEMQELAKRQAQTWQDVEQTLASGYTASNYDHATSLLDQIPQLADFQGTQNNFDARVKLLAEKYKARTALIGRWKRKGWV